MSAKQRALERWTDKCFDMADELYGKDGSWIIDYLRFSWLKGWADAMRARSPSRRREKKGKK